MAIYFNDTLKGMAKVIAAETPAFPISRYDARAFIWQDAFFEGNYCALPSEAKGSIKDRKFNYAFLKNYHADKSHFNCFEVELDGMRLRDYFQFVGQKIEKTEEGFEKHVVTLSYPDKKALVHVCTQLDGSSFLLRWLEIENVGDAPFRITGMFPMSGMLYTEHLNNNFRAEHLRPNFYLGTFKDNYYLAESEFEWMELPKATVKFAHEHPVFNPPMYVLKDDVTCMYTMIHIETSMMPQAEFTKCGDYCFTRNVTNQDYLHFKVGVDKRATYRTVQAGEKVVSPKVHFGQLYGDLDDCVNAFNEHLRLSVIPKRQHAVQFPIKYHMNAPDCRQMDKEYLMKMVDQAAEFDVDMVVMDAGWFGSEKGDWWRQRGDWYETESLDGGLAEAFDYARSKGLMCGLWMEAEGIDMGSELAKEHPEWHVQAYGKKLPTLNLMLPEVREYVYNSISGVIEKYKLDLFRIDGGLKEPSEEKHGEYIEGTSWKYYEYLFEIIEALRKKYPHVYFENCSGGGGRSDLAIMRRFDWMQTTDSFSPSAQVRVIYGMSLAQAPEQLMSITSCEYMYHDVDFVARSSLLGVLDFILPREEVEEYSPVVVDAWGRAIRLYKEHIRPMLAVSKIFHHTPFVPYMEKCGWLVWELVSPDKDKAVIGLFRLSGESENSFLVKPRGISAAEEYELYFDNTGEKVRVKGYDLLQKGCLVTITGRLMSEMLVLSKVNK